LAGKLPPEEKEKKQTNFSLFLCAEIASHGWLGLVTCNAMGMLFRAVKEGHKSSRMREPPEERIDPFCAASWHWHPR